MQIQQTLYDHFAAKASEAEISLVSIGLGYTAVGTADGGVGVSSTYFARKTSCTMVTDTIDYEGRPASELLPKLFSQDPIDRSLALALVNCLNFSYCRQLPTDPQNKILMRALGVGSRVRIAMVGAGPPYQDDGKKRGAGAGRR